jgi:hypothetical protein
MQGNWIGAFGSTMLKRLCEPTSLSGLRSQVEPTLGGQIPMDVSRSGL